MGPPQPVAEIDLLLYSKVKKSQTFSTSDIAQLKYVSSGAYIQQAMYEDKDRKMAHVNGSSDVSVGGLRNTSASSSGGPGLKPQPPDLILTVIFFGGSPQSLRVSTRIVHPNLSFSNHPTIRYYSF
jgi:hypothetical protein